MRKYLRFLPIFLLLSLGLTGCNGGGETAADSFTLNVECESEGIYQIFYTFYLDGEEMGMGGMADLDGGPLGEEPLSITFTSAFRSTFPPTGKMTPPKSRRPSRFRSTPPTAKAIPSAFTAAGKRALRRSWWNK